ncbi:hypothetical protein C0081_15860 [Cohaesibacter celericrescens]|uniref:Uncharacterized protein n=1 Tax=Cohaesibacter celericrescens TaxID=2067669 RepID=A0A2N5XPK2_9HYPH|nr:hypothetical protein C0081_15860 [Cohaesibacter celericrescens]
MHSKDKRDPPLKRCFARPIQANLQQCPAIAAFALNSAINQTKNRFKFAFMIGCDAENAQNSRLLHSLVTPSLVNVE